MLIRKLCLTLALFSAITLFYLKFFKFPIHHSSQISNKTVEEVFNDLKKYAGNPMMIPQLIIIDNAATVNAYANNKNIGIYTGMLKLLKTRDELAFVLGHEIGHIMLDHINFSKSLRDSRILEANADKYSIYLMIRAGYDICQAKDLWTILRNETGDNTVTGSHPDYSFRIWELTFRQCSH